MWRAELRPGRRHGTTPQGRQHAGHNRIGTAFALREGLTLTRPDDFGPADGSNVNVGSVDPGGELRDLLQALHPDLDEDPYRVVETLMSVGVLAIDERLATSEIHSLRTLISPEA